ncbi:MAG: hypothetical protein M3157_07245 [Actinomycetota bacterium]|nr:hypothetical protein [Actinomycetota bacterium]
MQVVTSPRLALLPEEPAGLIPTRTPGAIGFEATLAWQSPEEAVRTAICPALPRSVKARICETDGPGEIRRISGELRAFAERDLEHCLDSVLRTLTSTAAVSEAVLEIRSVRVARPRAVPRGALERLARGLWEAGLGVRFGPGCTPLYDGAEVAVGIRGAEAAYERLRDRGSWEIVSRPL